MTEYALVRPDNTIDRIQTDSSIDPSVSTRTGWRWLPIVHIQPSIDPNTEVLVGPTITVGVTNVQRVYTSRLKTAQELDADKENKIPDAAGAIFRVLFNHENRIRTLEQRPQVTADQFRTALKGLL